MLAMLILMLFILMLILVLLNLNTGYADTEADLCIRIMSLCCISFVMSFPNSKHMVQALLLIKIAPQILSYEKRRSKSMDQNHHYLLVHCILEEKYDNNS